MITMQSHSFLLIEGLGYAAWLVQESSIRSALPLATAGTQEL